MNFLCVFVGGGLGAITRYAISLMISPSEKGFPYQTLLANVISSLILGLLMYYFMQRDIGYQYKLLLATGFCGGFSTFSTFSYEAFDLIQNEQVQLAFLYIIVSVPLCILCIWTGFLVGRHLTV